MSGDGPPDVDPRLFEDPTGDDAASEPESLPSGELVPSAAEKVAPADPLRRYLAEARRHPPLDRDAERELARRYRDSGDREALFRLVTANLLLVVRVAYSFRRAARNLLDLIQEGNLGLLHAVERFDPELGVRLPTYAAWWVRAYMVRFLLDNVRLVRVGTTNARRKLLRNLRKEKQRLEQLGYEVGPKQLAEHFGVSEKDVAAVEQALAGRDVSLDEPVGSERETTRAEFLPDAAAPGVDQVVARGELQSRAEEAIAEFRADLGERDLLLLDGRILADDPLTLQAVGDRFGTTREAARQAEQRLMKRLREFLRERLDDLGSIRIGPD